MVVPDSPLCPLWFFLLDACETHEAPRSRLRPLGPEGGRERAVCGCRENLARRRPEGYDVLAVPQRDPLGGRGAFWRPRVSFPVSGWG